MCVVRLGGCPIFQKMIIKYLVPGTDLGWVPLFSRNCSSGIGIGYQFGVVVSTPLGTRKDGTGWVSILNWVTGYKGVQMTRLFLTPVRVN